MRGIVEAFCTDWATGMSRGDTRAQTERTRGACALQSDVRGRDSAYNSKLYWKQTFPAVARNMRGNRQVKRSKTNSLANGSSSVIVTTAVRNAAVDLVPHWKGVVPSSLGSGTALLLASRLAPGPPSLPRKE
ncbi:hypothetical protein ROHU_011578 [Labeo rohita]|uniref:Uncharacterized protein n=1 Tax=Labeo rohita TaxID=84645 RepID=A0A498LMN7_LABRO|nr:hypothetical protein ROHU_011578 [Labeo rohita]